MSETYQTQKGSAPVGRIDVTDFTDQEDKIYPIEGLSKEQKNVIKHLIECGDEELLEMLPRKGDKITYIKTNSEAKEARLLYVHRMTFRGASNQDIADKLQCSPRNVTKIRRVLDQRIRDQICRMDFGLFAGYTHSFFEEVRSSCMLLATSKNASVKEKVYAMSMALRAQNDMIAFLEKCKVFSTLSSDNSIAGAFTSHQQEDQDEITVVMDNIATALKNKIPTLAAPVDADA